MTDLEIGQLAETIERLFQRGSEADREGARAAFACLREGLSAGRVLKPGSGIPLVVPEGAVVVPGARAVTQGMGPAWGLSVATPVIIKYRDERTDARTSLEDWIR